MRAWCLVMLLSGCSCSEKKAASSAPSPAAPSVPPPPTAAPAPKVSATWMQQSLTPQKTELAARIEYGPSPSTVTVQLELPPGAQVTQGRTYFTLEPTLEPRLHVERFTVVSQSLPVRDLVLIVAAPGLTLREPYRFGRR